MTVISVRTCERLPVCWNDEEARCFFVMYVYLWRPNALEVPGVLRTFTLKNSCSGLPRDRSGRDRGQGNVTLVFSGLLRRLIGLGKKGSVILVSGIYVPRILMMVHNFYLRSSDLIMFIVYLGFVGNFPPQPKAYTKKSFPHLSHLIFVDINGTVFSALQ